MPKKKTKRLHIAAHADEVDDAVKPELERHMPMPMPMPVKIKEEMLL